MIDYRYAKLDAYMMKVLELLFKTRFKQFLDFNNFLDKISDELVEYVVREPKNSKKYVVDKEDYYYLPYHSINTAIYSISAAYASGERIENLKKITKAAFLHDAGMTKLPDKIFTSDKKLSSEELFLVQQHPEHSLSIIHEEDDDIKKIILSHHEFATGCGYPRGIPLEMENDKLSILLSISDAFDAMISFRVYRKKLSVDEAKLKLLESSNIRWNRDSLNNFFKGLKRLEI